MNATYELIETYPGSPPLGTRVDNIREGLIEKTFLNGKKVTLEDILKYPQFWKEIIEKDYEIMSYIYNDIVYYLKTDGYYKNKIDENVLYEYNKKTIHSIRRLNDNVILTIGDKVEHVDDNRDHGVINKIEVNNTRALLYFGNKFENNMYVLKHSKQILFITEDSVDISKNENYYYVDGLYYINYVNYKHNPFMIEEHYKNTIFKTFAKKGNAEQYVLNNKPCLSLKDLCKFISTHLTNYAFYNTIAYNKLKEIVKTKL